MPNRLLDMERGDKARRILEEDLIKEAFDLMESNYNNTWRNSHPEQLEAREEAYRMLICLEKFKLQLTSVLQTGTLAKTAVGSPTQSKG